MFVPRLTAPSETDPKWIRQAYGGLNPGIQGWGSTGASALANCTSYAVGRAIELYGLDDAMQLPWQCNAKEYFPNLKESEIWKKSNKPSLGAIICFYRWDDKHWAM